MTRNWMRAAMAWCVMVGLACAQSQSVSLVQLTDMRGNVEYQILDREELTALQKALKEETTAFPAAVAEAKKLWESDKEKNKGPFQGNRVKPRAMKKMGGDFVDREKASKKKAQLDERVANKQLEEAEKESKQREKLKDSDKEKEAARTKAFEDAFMMISKIMGEKLGRPVPAISSVFDSKK